MQEKKQENKTTSLTTAIVFLLLAVFCWWYATQKVLVCFNDGNLDIIDVLLISYVFISSSILLCIMGLPASINTKNWDWFVHYMILCIWAIMLSTLWFLLGLPAVPGYVMFLVVFIFLVIVTK